MENSGQLRNKITIEQFTLLKIVTKGQNRKRKDQM